MVNDLNDSEPCMIHFDCPVVIRLWEYSGVPAGEDALTQFLCKVVWECPRLFESGDACGICGAVGHNAVRDLEVFKKINSKN